MPGKAGRCCILPTDDCKGTVAGPLKASPGIKCKQRSSLALHQSMGPDTAATLRPRQLLITRTCQHLPTKTRSLCKLPPYTQGCSKGKYHAIQLIRTTNTAAVMHLHRFHKNISCQCWPTNSNCPPHIQFTLNHHIILALAQQNKQPNIAATFFQVSPMTVSYQPLPTKIRSLT